MNQQDYTGYIHSTSEQVQSQSEQAQSHGQVQFGGGQTQSSDSSTAIQMLKNENKPREEIKPEDKEEQKREAEKSLEAIRRFNQVNEEVKELHDKQVAKTKQRSEDMKNLMLEAEAKYHPDLDLRSSLVNHEQSSFTDQSKDLRLRNSLVNHEQSSFIDQSKDSDRDSDRDSSDDFVYVQKPKTNKFKSAKRFHRCEECNEELTLKRTLIDTLNHLNIKRMYDYTIEIKLLRVLMRME